MGRNPFGNKPLTGSEAGPLPVSPFPEGVPPTGEVTSVRGHIENIPTANFQPKKRVDKRQRGLTRFVQLTESNYGRMLRLVEQTSVPQYEIIRYALEHALQRYQTGVLVLEPVLAKGALTLFPESARGQRKRKQKLVNLSVRHLPDEVWATLKTLMEIVPLWQVVNRLLDDTFTQIEQKQIFLQAQRAGLYTLYPDE